MMVRPEVDERLHDARAFRLGVGFTTTNGYSTRQSVASVTCETRAMPVELHVVAPRDRGEPPLHLAAQAAASRELVLEGGHRRARGVQQLRDMRIARGIVPAAPRLDLVQR
jgi:hypothetical protein